MGMDLYKALSLHPIDSKCEPEVWVRRLVIYEQITPDPVLVREVSLTKGLNIIWAEEPENDNASAEITGHSAGKTTFCRLLRYVLGEKTFGTKANMELIQKAFPGGYVGAELCVRQQWWVVIRPIGSGRNSYIRPTATIEELLADKTRPAYQDDYPQKIGLDALLDNLETGAVVRTNEPIQWGHLLAWCTRDQEARFQNVYDWRSPRSESDWTNFRFSKAGPLFVMRTLLGLFLPDELKGEEKLSKLHQEKEGLEKRLEELKQEPQFRVNLYEKELRHRLQAALPDEQGVEDLPLHWDKLLPDLDRLTDKAVGQLSDAIAKVESSRKDLQDEIDEIGGKISSLEVRQETIVSLFGLHSAAGQELDAGLKQRQKVRNLLDQHGNATCLLGNVLYSQCEYVQERQRVLKFTQLQDARAMEQAEAKGTEAQQALAAQKKQIADSLTQLRSERERLQSDRDRLWPDIRNRREEIRDLKHARDQLATWTERRSRAGEYKELDDCQKNLTEVTGKIDKLEVHLNRLLAQHDGNRDLVASIFSGAVRAVLSSGTYDGRVSLANRELEFRITHGPAMSGEAVETLSVLLADVACLVYNSVSDKARLPGFLLHDSPREADLGLRIYHSFIRLVAALQSHFGSAEKCPFQYILTTTTPPPSELQHNDFVRLQLNAAVLDELLLRRNIAVTSPDEGGRLPLNTEQEAR